MKDIHVKISDSNYDELMKFKKYEGLRSINKAIEILIRDYFNESEMYKYRYESSVYNVHSAIDSFMEQERISSDKSDLILEILGRIL